MKKPETRFKEQIRPLLEALPRTWIVKIQMLAVRGIPDFLLCVNGHFVALELKKDKGEEPDELQKWNIAKIIRAGGIALIVSPENWDQVYRMLLEIAAGRVVFQPESPPPEQALDS